VPTTDSTALEVGRTLEAQFTTFIGGGPESCFLDESATLPYAVLTSDDTPFVGQKIQMCIAGFRPGSLDLVVESFDGAVHVSRIVVEEQTDIDQLVDAPMTGNRDLRAVVSDKSPDGAVTVIQTETWFIDQTVPSGRYRFAVSQGSVVAASEYLVGPATAPGIRSVLEGPDNGVLTFALYGYAPHEHVPVGIYGFAGEALTGGSRYELVMELAPVLVDERGFRLLPLDVAALGIPAHQNAEVSRDLCLISAGVDPLDSNVQCAISSSRRPSSGFHIVPNPSFQAGCFLEKVCTPERIGAVPSSSTPGATTAPTRRCSAPPTRPTLER
jgi:hypothetical protein